MGRVTTIGELFDSPGFKKRAATSFETSAPNRLQKAAEMEADFLRRGLHKIKKGADVSDDLAQEWARTHPREALEWGMARVKDAVASEYVAAGRAINDAKIHAQTEIGQWPSDLAKAKYAAAVAAHRKTPDSIAAGAKLANLYKRRDDLLAENIAGADLTHAQRRARSELARAIVAAEITRDEPRVRPDREIVA